MSFDKLQEIPVRKLIVNAVLSSLTLSAPAWAQVTVPNTFTAGAPARAADVNANFQALVTAINALGARVTKLEPPTAAADFAGTYAMQRFQTELGGGGSARVAVYTSSDGTVTLAADGTATRTSSTEQGHQLNLPGDTLTPFSGSSDAAGAITWTYSGGKVTIFGGTFSVADGGRLLIRTSANPADGTNVLLMLVRTN